MRRTSRSTLFPYTTLFRSILGAGADLLVVVQAGAEVILAGRGAFIVQVEGELLPGTDGGSGQTDIALQCAETEGTALVERADAHGGIAPFVAVAAAQGDFLRHVEDGFHLLAVVGDELRRGERRKIGRASCRE